MEFLKIQNSITILLAEEMEYNHDFQLSTSFRSTNSVSILFIYTVVLSRTVPFPLKMFSKKARKQYPQHLC